MNRFDALLEKIVAFANHDERVTAVIMIGSQARPSKAADEYSDIDLIWVTSDTNCFIHSNDWLSAIGTHHIAFTEKTIAGADEKRVMFEDALDVDFIIVSSADMASVLADGAALSILQSGYRILVDKVGIQAAIPSPIPSTPYVFPSEDTYANVVHDFWYHAIWTTKKLLRGELWAAKFCLDGYMKHKLLWMVECYEHAHHGTACNTWYNGRFIDTWAEDGIMAQLATTFAHYDRQDMALALKKTMALFRHLASRAAKKAGYTYPLEADEYAARWVNGKLD